MHEYRENTKILLLKNRERERVNHPIKGIEDIQTVKWFDWSLPPDENECGDIRTQKWKKQNLIRTFSNNQNIVIVAQCGWKKRERGTEREKEKQQLQQMYTHYTYSNTQQNWIDRCEQAIRVKKLGDEEKQLGESKNWERKIEWC